MICPPFTGQPVKGYISLPKGFCICNNGGSTKNRRFIIPYYLNRALNKFCNKESKELRMSCAVLSVEFVFVVLAVVTEPAVLVGSAVTVVLAAGAGVTVVVTGSTGALPVDGVGVNTGGRTESVYL